MEFKAFDKISRVSDLQMVITQKIHGTNAAVIVFDKDGSLDLICCSRTRFIYPDDDNFGFAGFVHANKEAFLKLGVGRHDGEWAGPGINSGEGLIERKFVLFDFWRYAAISEMPPNTVAVPVLYQGLLSPGVIGGCMETLLVNGSSLVPGFMRTEGIVVSLNGRRFKQVFAPEETGWEGSRKPKRDKRPPAPDAPEVSHLVQPIRLEKLLSRDERYSRNYPDSLGEIVKDYIQDLRDENQIEDYDAVKKQLTGQVYRLVRATLREPE